jgi:hypothetical protein
MFFVKKKVKRFYYINTICESQNKRGKKGKNPREDG